MAATAISASYENEDSQCCICNELFDTPKLLPCSHTVCRHCLLSWLDTNPKGLCPMCRRAIVDPKQRRGQTSEEVVDGLPTDLAMDAVVASVRTLSINHTCDGCMKNAAASICLTCADKYCQTCCDVHKNSSLSRDHKVEDLSTMTPELLASSQPTFCRFHSNKPAELFCPTHSAAICHLCASAKHRSCPDVVFFENRVEELRAELSGMCIKLTTAEEKLDNDIIELDELLTKMEKQGEEALTNIDADCDRLETSMKACRRRLKQRAISKVAEEKDKLSKVKDTFREKKGGLTTHRVSVDRVKRAMPAKFLNDVNLTLKSRIKDLDLTATIHSDAKAFSAADLTIDRKALEHIEKELNNLDLGQLAVQSSQVQVITDPDGQRYKVEKPITQDPVRIFKTQEGRTFYYNSVTKKSTWDKPDDTKPNTEGRTWRFHSNHGKNISLSCNGQTARFTGWSLYGDGIILSSEPMVVDMLYEVEVDENNPDQNYALWCGAVLTSWAVLPLPESAWDWDLAVVFSGGGKVCVQGTKKQNRTLGEKLRKLSVGHRVGLVIDDEGCLYLLINGSRVVAWSDAVTGPCYAFFSLHKRYSQIKTLPLQQMIWSK